MAEGMGSTSAWTGTASTGTLGSANTGTAASDMMGGSREGSEVGGSDENGNDDGVGEQSGGDASDGGSEEDVVAVEDRFLMYQGDAVLERSAVEGLLVNDLLGSDDALLAEVVSSTTDRGGRVEVDPSGGFVYEPPADAFWGEDAFRYVALSSSGARSAGLVRIIVHPRMILQSQLEGSPSVATFDGESAAASRTGHWVHGGGDLDGDGVPDVVVGTGDGYTVWFGASDSTAAIVSLVHDTSGYSRGGGLPGDINGDGLDDLVVGSVREAGRVYVVFGDARWNEGAIEELADSPGGFVISGEQDGDYAGDIASPAGDVNGDGLADIIVSAPRANGVGEDGEVAAGAGRFYVVYGKTDSSPVALSDVAAGRGGFVLLGENESEGERKTIAGVHDVNGDGLADVVIGDPSSNDQEGKAYVVFGKRDGLPVELRHLASAGGGFVVECDEGARCGYAVAGAGDVNGDGLADVLVGAPGGGNGVVLLVHGKTTVEAVTMSALSEGIEGLFIEGGADLQALGSSVGAAGDVNADGLADLVFADPWAQTAQLVGDSDAYLEDAGIAYVMFGRRDSARVQASELSDGSGGFVVVATSSRANMGHAVAPAGDVDGDGFAEIIIGVPDNGNLPIGGAVHVISGADFSLAATKRATSVGEDLMGTDADEVLLGGRGDDTIESGGGDDVIYGGPGGDTIILTDGRFFRLQGGHGDDTVRLGNEVDLDLTGVPAFAFHGVETIDLSGSGANGLVMELRHFTADAGRRVLWVVGDDNDAVRIDLRGGAFEEVSIEEEFVLYSNGNIALRVDADVRSTILLR